MSKGTTFVIIYSVFILGLFCLFCFLMSGVNPKPLEESRKSSADLYKQTLNNVNNQSSPNSTFARRSFDIEDIYYNESLFPVSFVSPEFGLEKVDGKSPYAYTLFQVTATNNIEDDNKSENNVTDDTEDFNKTHILVKSLKGHRRSVNFTDQSEEYNRIIEKSGDVILKIIDDSGQSRIEIKIGSNESLQKLRTNRSLMKTKSKANDEQFNKSKLTTTIIKIMPNNSVIVDDFEDNANLNITSTKDIESLDNKNITTKTPVSINNLEMLLITPENALNISSDNMTGHKTDQFEDTFDNDPSIRNSTKTSTNKTDNNTIIHRKVNLMSIDVKNMSTNNFSTSIFSSELYYDRNIENTTKPISIDVSNVMRVLKQNSQDNSTVSKKLTKTIDSMSTTVTYKETSTNISEVIKYS